MFKDYKHQGGKYKWVLTDVVVIETGLTLEQPIATPFIQMTVTGRLTAVKGYAWDGATGAIDTDTVMLGSLVHDILYQLIRLKLLPKTYRVYADKLFYTINIKEGMFKLRALYMLLAVRLVGWKFI